RRQLPCRVPPPRLADREGGRRYGPGSGDPSEEVPVVRMEPQTVDLERWPALAPPTRVGGGGAGLVAQALRRAARDLGIRIDYPDASAAGDYDAAVRVVLRQPELFWARVAASGVVG